MCAALGLPRTLCKKALARKFKQVKHVMEGYCASGLCMGGAGEWLVTESIGRAATACYSASRYCARMCAIFVDLRQHVAARCRASCRSDFDGVRKVWDDYCSAGVC
mmetsp:Transcript_119856/g.333362  ORF Transcript_119856/g.333362 Transcript_119856/m.333362 type:complete len:106 (-) Transcript_119856:110-427(-)